jgi:predicted site-specific integrase-resolvase
MDTFVTKKEELEKQVENSEENKKKRQSELEDIKKNLDEQKKKN